MSDPDANALGATWQDGAAVVALTIDEAGMAKTREHKLAVARLLDEYGVGFIEGGWPGALPKDTEFFQRAQTELTLVNAQLVAFGATRKAGVAVEEAAANHSTKFFVNEDAMPTGVKALVSLATDFLASAKTTP